MKRRIAESMSMEEAFKSLNNKNRSKRKLTETVLYDRKPTYYRDKLTRDDSLEHTFNKIIQGPLSDALDQFEVTSVSDPNFEKCIDEVVNNLGIISDCDITYKMILKAKVRELGEYLIRSENESLNENTGDSNDSTDIPQVKIRDIDLDRSNYKFALWVSGEVAAYYRNYDAAEEALDNLKGQGFDLAIIDADSNETLYADWY